MSDVSLFDSSMDDSSKSGYSSNQQQTSISNVTTLKHKRKADAMCGESDFDGAHTEATQI
jgi:hypothetical protein